MKAEWLTAVYSLLNVLQYDNNVMLCTKQVYKRHVRGIQHRTTAQLLLLDPDLQHTTHIYF